MLGGGGERRDVLGVVVAEGEEDLADRDAVRCSGPSKAFSIGVWFAAAEEEEEVEEEAEEEEEEEEEAEEEEPAPDLFAPDGGRL